MLCSVGAKVLKLCVQGWQVVLMKMEKAKSAELLYLVATHWADFKV